jgi:hypothetical protein
LQWRWLMGRDFLNYFKPANHQGRIVTFNYEVSENQYRRWMKDISIENSGRVTLVSPSRQGSSDD